MDSHNLFETPTTYRALRAEYLVPLGVAVVLLAIHIEDVRILPALLLFFYNDLIGYLPGAIAYRRNNGRISKVYYVLYNAMHSIVSAAIIAGLWALLIGPEWAMLVMAVHIGIDRAVFGNFMKPFSVSFEPKEHPVWAAVKDALVHPAPGEPAAAEVAPLPEASVPRVGTAPGAQRAA